MLRTLILGAFLGGLAICGVPDWSDVQPIFATRCATCHKAGEIGPMPLTTYREARPWARAIREAVVRRSMPPWHADDATSPHFLNNRSLPESERTKLIAWVDGGAKGSESNAIPDPAKVEKSQWTLGQPDLIVRVPGYQVPKTGTVQYTFLV
ncbi:MAG TPA: cytochrome c, partial [Bryobacteraceae bacterium]|nr:cytochrome c [Bryobacteraceae bacterium]